jgi:PAS domain-containing protein
MLGELCCQAQPDRSQTPEVKQRADDDLVQYGQRQSLFKIGTLMEKTFLDCDPAAAQIVTEVRREEALLKAGALQKAIFNSANFSSIATDAKGVIQIFNVGAERMLGVLQDRDFNCVSFGRARWSLARMSAPAARQT